MQRMLLIAIGISGLMAVMMGAAATHWLAATMPPADILRVEKAATYQMYHTLALLALAMGGLAETWRTKWAIPAFALGITLFSGSLYAYSFTHIKLLVYITPIGGIMLMIGWLAVAGAGFFTRQEKK